MGAIAAVFLIFGALALWVFFSFTPRHADPKQVSVFNWAVLGACALICIGWLMNIGTLLTNVNAEKYLAVFAIMGAVAIEVIFLAVCLVLRNFWIFKPPRRPGSGFF